MIMKICPQCGTTLDENARFCHVCGAEYLIPGTKVSGSGVKTTPKTDVTDNPLLGDKNLINESTIIGKQDKYEASNITIHNTVTEDHSRTTVVCSVSGKRVYLDHSVVCPECGKPVAVEYYVEASKRCEHCETYARETFRKTASHVLAEGPLDKNRKQCLDEEAHKLHLKDDIQHEILRSLLKNLSVTSGRLNAVQEAEMEKVVKELMQLDAPASQRQALESLAVLHESTGNDTVDFWYFLGLAILTPEQAILSYEEELTDNYWQRYWGYLAYSIAGSPKSSMAIDRLQGAFGERENDIRLAEAIYCMIRWFGSPDHSMRDHAKSLAAQIQPEYLSRSLVFLYSTLQRVLKEGIRLEEVYTPEEEFALIAVFRAGEYVAHLRAEKQEQRDRWVREQQLAEQARKQRQAEMEAERMQRMEREVARLKGLSETTLKAFAGYETDIPTVRPRKGRKRIFWIIFGILIILILALFLIPVPESWQ